MGPYFDKDGVDLMEGGGTLLLETDGPFIGPGHASVLQQDDKFWFSCHYYDGTERGRSMLAIRPLNWGDDGWPVLCRSNSQAPIPNDHLLEMQRRASSALGSRKPDHNTTKNRCRFAFRRVQRGSVRARPFRAQTLRDSFWGEVIMKHCTGRLGVSACLMLLVSRADAIEITGELYVSLDGSSYTSGAPTWSTPASRTIAICEVIGPDQPTSDFEWSHGGYGAMLYAPVNRLGMIHTSSDCRCVTCAVTTLGRQL